MEQRSYRQRRSHAAQPPGAIGPVFGPRLENRGHLRRRISLVDRLEPPGATGLSEGFQRRRRHGSVEIRSKQGTQGAQEAQVVTPFSCASCASCVPVSPWFGRSTTLFGD